MKLASLEIIKDIQPHPNADRLDVAKVLSWQVVVERNKFKEGDKEHKKIKKGEFPKRFVSL